MNSVVAEKQLCEHLADAQLKTLLGRKQWTFMILPTSLLGKPVRIDKMGVNKFKVTHAQDGQSVEDLRSVDRVEPPDEPPDEPLSAI